MPFDLQDRLLQTPRPLRTVAPQPMRELQSSGDIKILIIDDDSATCAVIQAALANRDFQTEIVSDPILVESALRNSTYNLIILDYVLPGLEAEDRKSVV